MWSIKVWFWTFGAAQTDSVVLHEGFNVQSVLLWRMLNWQVFLLFCPPQLYQWERLLVQTFLKYWYFGDIEGSDTDCLWLLLLGFIFIFVLSLHSKIKISPESHPENILHLSAQHLPSVLPVRYNFIFSTFLSSILNVYSWLWSTSEAWFYSILSQTVNLPPY